MKMFSGRNKKDKELPPQPPDQENDPYAPRHGNDKVPDSRQDGLSKGQKGDPATSSNKEVHDTKGDGKETDQEAGKPEQQKKVKELRKLFNAKHIEDPKIKKKKGAPEPPPVQVKDTEKIQSKIDETKEIMLENIEEAKKRGEDLSEIQRMQGKLDVVV